MPPSSYGFYFDGNDPSFFGERGMNLASPWNWALFVAPIALFGLPVLLTLWSALATSVSEEAPSSARVDT